MRERVLGSIAPARGDRRRAAPAATERHVQHLDDRGPRRRGGRGARRQARQPGNHLAFGSADVLDALGVRTDHDDGLGRRGAADRRLRVHARDGLPPGDEVRRPDPREIGVRTAFNLLGPLTNPAGAPGWSLAWSTAAARGWPRCSAAGQERAIVVHGAVGRRAAARRLGRDPRHHPRGRAVSAVDAAPSTGSACDARRNERPRRGDARGQRRARRGGPGRAAAAPGAMWSCSMPPRLRGGRSGGRPRGRGRSWPPASPIRRRTQPPARLRAAKRAADATRVGAATSGPRPSA